MSRLVQAISLFVCLLLASPYRVPAQVVISEFLASNQSKLADENGDYSDWIELHNTNSAPVNLDGWYLTDNAANLTKWRLPATNIAAQGYLVVFASGKNRALPGARLHTSFSLSADGEYLGLVLPDGQTIASEYAPSYPEQVADISYGRLGDTEHYFRTPTPGQPNSTNLFVQVADTKFSQDRGFYEAPISLVITTTTAGATIRYTTNGSVPALTNGLVYSTPLNIARTTVIRAAAFKAGLDPSDVDTQTYLFLADIIRQSTNGAAPPGWPSSWKNNVVDYGMDPGVVNNAAYRDTISNDLRTLPSVSLVMNLNDLFGSNAGIYSNPTQSGRAWERPGSVELIYPDGTKGFQINAGLRIRGNFSTSTSNPKHSFRMFFRGEYGDSSLKFPLFGPGGTDTFPGGLDLATFQNYSWSNPGNPGENALFVRDHFGRDTQLAMGHQGERGIYAHLYINGQYWGIYSPSERPEGSFAATYFGGQETDYDVVKATGGPNYTIEPTDGDLNAWLRLWRAATNGFTATADYQRVQGNNPDGTRNLAYEILVDADNLIDYQLVAIYTGSRDGPLTLTGNRPNNWYGIRRRDGTMGFQFFVHDFEHSLLDLADDRTPTYIAGDPSFGSSFEYSSPQYIWQRLRQNADFRMRVADRVQRHFFNGGVLTVTSCLARFNARTNQLDRAIVGESARWGDANKSTPYTRNGTWVPLARSMATNYFPRRSGIVLGQLQQAGLFPTVAAPLFSQRGGGFTNGFPLSLTGASTVYYTLDQSDPRLPGGGISPTARTYSSALILSTNVQIRARVRSGTTWSALDEAEFTLLQDFSGLVPTEIMYHPPTFNGVDGDDFEFLELKNIGTNTLALGGVRFTNGVQFAFTNGAVLPAGGFAVLVSKETAFAEKYPGVAISGVYSGNLANGGETLTLVDSLNVPVFSFTYGDMTPWPTNADGPGFSLTLRILQSPLPLSDPAQWQASRNLGGSPGADEPDMENYATWSQAYFSATEITNSALAGPQADPDQDGQTNEQEFLAGTDPRSAGSFLHFETLTLVEGQTLTLRFHAAARRSYTVQYRSLDAESEWTKWQDVPMATEAKEIELTPDLQGAAGRMYRIVTPLQP